MDGTGNGLYTTVFEQYKQFKQESAKFHRKLTAKGLEIDPNFVGRAGLFTKIIEILQKRPGLNGPSSERHAKGVVLCGLPGMGKTSLAIQICNNLLCGSTTNIVRKWNVIVVNQRDRSEIGELLSDIIEGIGKEMGMDDIICEFNSVTYQRKNVMSLLAELGKSKRDYLVLLDDMDGHLNHEHSPCEEFLTDIFDTIAKVNNIQILMTVCMSMSKSDTTNVCGGKPAFRGHLMEYKVTGLSYEDAQKIISQISGREDEVAVVSMGDLTKAVECHKAAKASNCTRPSFISQRIEFAANIAACFHQMGVNTKTEDDRKKHFHDALKEYNNCISFNNQIGMEDSTTCLTMLRNRADIFCYTNHIKLMEKLGLSKKAIEKTQRKYQGFELGKFNKLLSKQYSYVPDSEEQERGRQAIVAGAEFMLDPDKNMDDSSNDWTDTDESESSSDDDTTADTHYAMVYLWMCIHHIGVRNTSPTCSWLPLKRLHSSSGLYEAW
ncbi:hypothetical protein DPMN_054067 [Dreissena polymorpha]|uniref:ORC1/DEAH AAA+ ATPase domain-containing protein n=1 Tax=Dreissena polymorpha TaxID=45954 RepID=A0A9D4CPV3_DREPO|nr:hypothetical protein DPMN_054067 [Dreissena polymorpha]